jgi:hypothetical protein
MEGSLEAYSREKVSEYISQLVKRSNSLWHALKLDFIFDRTEANDLKQPSRSANRDAIRSVMKRLQMCERLLADDIKHVRGDIDDNEYDAKDANVGTAPTSTTTSTGSTSSTNGDGRSNPSTSSGPES